MTAFEISGVLGVVLGLQHLPDDSGDDGTDDGCKDEDPDLLDGEGASLSEHHQGGSEGPGGVDGRAGEADGHEVDQNEGQTDDDPGLSGRGLGGCDSERGEDEDEGHQDLDEQRSCDGDVACGGLSVSVLSEAGDGSPVPDLGQDGPEQCGSDDGADELEHDVSGGVLGADPLVDEHSDGDRGVDVASGHASDAVGHRDHGQAEGESGADDPRGGAAADDRDTASDESEHHGADQLCHVFLDPEFDTY